MIVDTEIRHITKAGSNLFLELGFSATEVDALQIQSQQSINDAKLLKEQLMSEVSKWISENQLKQAQAATILNVTRPRVSDLVNKKTTKFTFDALVNMLNRIGKKIEFSVS